MVVPLDVYMNERALSNVEIFNTMSYCVAYLARFLRLVRKYAKFRLYTGVLVRMSGDLCYVSTVYCAVLSGVISIRFLCCFIRYIKLKE